LTQYSQHMPVSFNAVSRDDPLQICWWALNIAKNCQSDSDHGCCRCWSYVVQLNVLRFHYLWKWSYGRLKRHLFDNVHSMSLYKPVCCWLINCVIVLAKAMRPAPAVTRPDVDQLSAVPSPNGSVQTAGGLSDCMGGLHRAVLYVLGEKTQMKVLATCHYYINIVVIIVFIILTF